MSKTGKVTVALVAAIVVLGAGLWWVVGRDTAPEAASLDAIDVGGPGDGPAGTAAAPATPDGTWSVVAGDDVFVGYRIDEQFAADTITKTAAGRTPSVAGTVTIAGSTISAATVTADLTRLASDESRRDAAIEERGLETLTFPEATFTLTAPVELAAAPATGSPVTVAATGDLTLHGVTRPVTVELTAEWTGPAITVAGHAPVTLADFDIEAIEIPGFVAIADHGTLELQLVLQPA